MTTETSLADAVRRLLAGSGTIREVKMFGGIGFMLDGNMVAAVSKRGLLLRIGKDGHAAALEKPGVRPMEMRGRVMEGYVYVDPEALGRGRLKAWIGQAATFVTTLPPKPGKGRSASKAGSKGKKP